MLTIILIVAIIVLAVWIALSAARIAKVNELLLEAHARLDAIEAKVAKRKL
jgi:hypothetical protein